jgi:hypothetical protein
LPRYKGKTAERARIHAEWYWAHRDAILAKQKKQRSTPEYKQRNREYYQKHKKELNERQQQRRIERKAESFSEWHGDRPKSRNEDYMVWRNKMLDRRDKTCLVCGKSEPLDKKGHRLTILVLHHLDYNIPELTTTLCYSCHRQVHNGKIKLGFEAKECPLCKHSVYKVFQVK